VEKKKPAMSLPKTDAEALVVTLPDGREAMLVRITIDCPQCGKQQLEVLGHHLRAIRNFAQEFVDRFPHLCAEVTLTETTDDRFGGTPPKNPLLN
jgi:hypothetical protein